MRWGEPRPGDSDTDDGIIDSQPPSTSRRIADAYAAAQAALKRLVHREPRTDDTSVRSAVVQDLVLRESGEIQRQLPSRIIDADPVGPERSDDQ